MTTVLEEIVGPDTLAYWRGLKPVLLWTDVLVFLLVGVLVICIWYARRREHLRAPWRQVFARPLAMAAAVVMSCFVVVGLLDSVHFREPLQPQGGQDGGQQQEVFHAVEVLSLLDLLLRPLKEQVEKTYSAPFATHLYAKETLELPDGTRVRDYPRLVYGGAHLEDPSERTADVLQRSLAGLATGLGWWLLFALLWVALLAYRHHRPFGSQLRQVLAGRTVLPWRVMLGVLALVFMAVAWAVELAPLYHIFGTDKVGQDVFYQTLKSVRTALVIGTLTTLVMLPFAVLLGLMAGYFRGWVDDVIQYLYTTLNSIPGVLLIASAVLMLQVYIDTHPEMFETAAERADMRLLFLCIILGVTSWTTLCRLLRGEALKLHGVDYVQAAVAFGVPHFRILSRHLLPNVMHIVLITVVLDFSGLVLAEAILSYVGVGVDPSMHSWGNMINGARLEMAREPMVWWSLLAAFVFMFLLVLAANLLADAVRDAFDPRTRDAAAGRES